MLCSKLHYQKGFKLILLFYKIRYKLRPGALEELGCGVRRPLQNPNPKHLTLNPQPSNRNPKP